MDIVTVSQLIGTLGFPIVCCGALFWKINKQDAQHREENERLAEALNNNTLVMTKIYEKLGGDGSGKQSIS